jgi:S-adenosylmethionine:tRNA ribosyltransferase-isomerase
MKLSQFSFDLPKKLIRQYPLDHRDDSRMMIVHRETGQIEHKMFKDITSFFTEGDTLVYNDTMVFPARMYGTKEKTGAQIEVFLLRELNSEVHLWDVLVDPARKIRVGNKLYFGDETLVAEVVDNTTSRGRTIRFLVDGDDEHFYRTIEELGETPLPRDIGRGTEEIDKERFQTIFAQKKGAVAAPTAGLHFTPHVVKRMELQNVEMSPVTLHVGLGTFREVDVEDLTKHKMDSEHFEVPAETVAKVNKTLSAKKNVCAIGTTVARCLEASVSANGLIKENRGWTDKFIFPDYDFAICKSILTNFHKPKSTLMMTAAAFGGYDLIMEAYQTAIKEEYKFMTYGDAMLII